MGADSPRLRRLFSMSDDALPFQAVNFAARGGPMFFVFLIPAQRFSVYEVMGYRVNLPP